MAKVRVKATSAVKQALIASGKAVLLGTEALLETSDRYNKGERFERVITELLTGQEWRKDSIPFTDAGDIELNGKQIQIKLDQAELTNEKMLQRILTAAWGFFFTPIIYRVYYNTYIYNTYIYNMYIYNTYIYNTCYISMRLLCVRIDNTCYPRATASGIQHALYIVGRLDATNSGAFHYNTCYISPARLFLSFL